MTKTQQSRTKLSQAEDNLQDAAQEYVSDLEADRLAEIAKKLEYPENLTRTERDQFEAEQKHIRATIEARKTNIAHIPVEHIEKAKDKYNANHSGGTDLLARIYHLEDRLNSLEEKAK